MGRSIAAALIAGTSVFVWAGCSGGPGSLEFNRVSRDNPGSSRDTPTGGREAPVGGRESPGGTVGGGAASACVKCEGAYRCVGTSNNRPFNESSAASPAEGGCTIFKAFFACGGDILDDGQKVGTWTGSGASFSVVAGTTAFTCSPTVIDNPRPGNPPVDAGSGDTPNDGG